MATPEELLTESWKALYFTSTDSFEGTKELAAEGLLNKERRELKGIERKAAINYERCQDYQNGTKTI